VAEQQRDQQAPDAPVAVEERVDGLETCSAILNSAERY